MKALSRFFAVASIGLLSLCFAPAAQAQKSGDPEYLDKTPLNIDLKTLGDFILCDSKGYPFLVGRMVVDFGSIYTVIAEHPEARGECPFLHADYKEGNIGRVAVHHLRYFIRMDKPSIIYLNSETPDKEISVEFEFDPTKEIVSGSIRVPDNTGFKLVGQFKLRIKDPVKKPEPEAKKG